MARPFYPLVAVTWNTTIHSGAVLAGYYFRMRPQRRVPDGFHGFRLHQLTGTDAALQSFIAAFDHESDENLLSVQLVCTDRESSGEFLIERSPAEIARTTWKAELGPLLVYGPIDIIVPCAACAGAEDDVELEH